MHRMAKLIHPDGTMEDIDLHGIATDPTLAPLMHHQGVLTYLRQDGVPKLIPINPPEENEKPEEPEEPDNPNEADALDDVSGNVSEPRVEDSNPNPLEKEKKKDSKVGIFAAIIEFIVKLFK